MSDFMEIIKGRRSIRVYQEKDVPDEILSQVLEGIRWSPSWHNSQCWEIIVVKDPKDKRRLQEATVKQNPAFRALGEAPVVLAVCGKLKVSGCHDGQPVTKFGDWFLFDLGLATQNFCLTAHALGLGSVIIGFFDHNQVKEILNVPEGYEVVVLLPLGYPANVSKAPKRREISEFRHDGTF